MNTVIINMASLYYIYEAMYDYEVNHAFECHFPVMTLP